MTAPKSTTKRRAARALALTLAALPLFMGGCASLDRIGGRAPFSATLVDDLEPLFLDAAGVSDKGRGAFRIDAARGTIAGVHILLRDLPIGGKLRIRAAGRCKGLGGAAPQLYRLLDVPVEINSGLHTRTEKWDGKRNPHVIRRAPFRIYEALRPLEEVETVDAPTIALAVQVPISPDAVAGKYEVQIGIRVGRRSVARRLLLRVHSATVPPIGRDTMCFTNWPSAGKMVEKAGVEVWSDAFWPILDRYAAMMAKGRQNTILVPLQWKERDGRIVLDGERTKRFIDAFKRHGVYYLEGGHIAREGGGGLVTGRGRKPVQSEEGTAEFVALFREIRGFIKKNGLEGRWIQHVKDEPGNHLAEDYAHVAKLIHEHLPGVPVIDACDSRQFAGAIDVWCPTVNVYQNNKAFYDERQAGGDRVWVYTCLTPTGPWINRLLDQERLRPVYVGWGAARFGTQGFLHWGLNRHRVDPFEQSVIDHPAAPNTNNQLPAGDTHVLYPGPDGPWSSTRFEAHRVGLEDHELLRQLEQKDPGLCRRIIASVFRGYDNYETDVSAYRFAKRRLLEALSE